MDSTLDVGRRIVQMLWDPDPTNDTSKDVPVWCLGSSYRLKDRPSSQPWTRVTPTEPVPAPPQPVVNQVVQDEVTKASSTSLPDTPPDSVSTSLNSSLAYKDAPPDGGWPPAFLDDFESRIWMTYRAEFEPIPKSLDPKALAALSFSMRIKTQLSDQNGFTSDTGWGCMIRSGQSLLANAMLAYRYGGSPKRGQSREHEAAILQLFADDPRAPYSLHNFVRHGATACGKYPGEWFGPSATARCIQALAKANDSSLRVYSTGDGPDVYEDKFFEVAKPDGENFHPTLILVGTRLGIDKITPVYWEALVASLQMPQSIGIAGGRPSSSHYFIGVQGLNFFYLDPHLTRPALPYHEALDDYTSEEIGTCHTRRLRRLHIREMDPSMLIGFLIRDEEEWKDWRRGVKHVQGKNIIHVSDYDPVAQFSQRAGAMDQIEALSDDDDEEPEVEEGQDRA